MSEGTARRPIVETPMIRRTRRPAPTVFIVGILFVAMLGLSIWYLSRREPLVIQGEVQSRTFDMAARVDGRIGEIVASRSQDVRRRPNWRASGPGSGRRSSPSARRKSTAPTRT
jgi:multidrug resistance efflux pump